MKMVKATDVVANLLMILHGHIVETRKLGEKRVDITGPLETAGYILSLILKYAGSPIEDLTDAQRNKLNDFIWCNIHSWVDEFAVEDKTGGSLIMTFFLDHLPTVIEEVKKEKNTGSVVDFAAFKKQRNPEHTPTVH